MEVEIYGRIYGVECLINHKIYVGQTTRGVKKRLSEHQHKKSQLGEDIRKYGWENFVWIILEECTPRIQLDESEKSWIKRLNCKASNGYNRASGGCSNYSHSSEVRAKISASNKGKHFDRTGKKDSAETRAKKSAAQLCNTKGRGNKGNSKSAAQKAKILASLLGNIPWNKGRKNTAEENLQNSIKKKQVIFPNLDAELNRQQMMYKDLADRLVIPKSTISSKLNGRRKLDEKTALAIRELLQVDTPLEILFARADA